MFINQIKHEGIKQSIFKEFQKKSVIDFANCTASGATSAATSFARKMNFIKDEADIKEINRKPFLYENLDE